MQSLEKTVELLKNKVVCDVNIEEKNKPKMKIVGINNVGNMNGIPLQQDINERNFTNYEGQGCTILHSYANKNKGTQTVLVELIADKYKHIRENKNKIFVGYEMCIAYDLIDSKPCYNCGRFGHKGKKCSNDVTCTKCTGDHATSECKVAESKCTNCVYSNDKYKTRYNINHEATDYDRCNVFKIWIRKFIDSTDYSVKPIISEVGKVDSYITKPMIARNIGLSVASLNSLNNSITNLY